MEIYFTPYAEDTLAERSIDKELVLKSIRDPDEIIDGKLGRKVAHKVIHKKLLRVIFEEEGKSYKVITVYFTSPQRYMKQ